MLSIDKSVEENLVYIDTEILLMKKLDVVINQEKSVMIPTQIIKLEGMKIDLKEKIILKRENSKN